jgi:serine/threonine-protein kinase
VGRALTSGPLPLEPAAIVGGKYRLVRRLAVGGMGEVWVATNRATRAEVAVKMCRADAGREDAVQRFRHEARLGAMLAHRSIVRVFDLVEDDGGTLVLVMELLRGESLERALTRRGPLPAADAIAVVLPVLSALAHAHDHGVVHRDVTPANVFLAVDPDGHVTPKLVDFGIAKLPAADAHTLDGRVLGTPRYMAPERIRARPDIDGRSDLFSLGVVLYEMLTGACPFAAASPAASLAAVLETVVDADPRIDPRIWIELQRALAKRAYERHADAREMAERLRAATGETEVQLAERLRALAPPEDDPTAAAQAQPTQTVGGHSWEGTGTRAGVRPWLAWAGGAAVAAASVTAIALVAIRPWSGAHAAGTPDLPMPAAAGTTQAAATLTPAASASAASALPATTGAPVPTPSSSAVATPAARSRAAPRARPTPKPVATTPGF